MVGAYKVDNRQYLLLGGPGCNTLRADCEACTSFVA